MGAKRALLGNSGRINFNVTDPLVFASFFTGLLLPLFSKVSGKDIVFSFQQHWLIVLGFLALAIVTGLIAGSYPAFYLSSFQPIKVLKGRISNSLAAVSLRKALVVFQFVISAGLIIASAVINKQMQYMRSKDLGFDREQQVVIPLQSASAKRIYPALKSELQKNAQIENIGASQFYPGVMNVSDMPLYKEGTNMNNAKRVFMNWVDDSYLQTLGVRPYCGKAVFKRISRRHELQDDIK
jgi:putative ABC transport system permease protein